jgi:hypothetical protein
MSKFIILFFWLKISELHYNEMLLNHVNLLYAQNKPLSVFQLILLANFSCVLSDKY